MLDSKNHCRKVKAGVRSAAALLGLLFSFAAHAALPDCGPQTSNYDWKNDPRPSSDGNLGYEGFQQRAHRTVCNKDWTLLIFMAADNDLAPYALKDINEIEAGYESGRKAGASSTVKADVIVQLDTRGNEGLRRIHLFQTDSPLQSGLSTAQFAARSAAQIRSPVVERVSEVDSAGKTLSRERQLEDFLRWGIRNYPSKKLMVIVWGHGQGWGTNASASTTGGLAIGENGTSRLSIPALARVLKRISATERSGSPIDVYASDACLMQMVEVADEIAASTSYIIGSAQVQSFEGLPYRRILYEITTGRWNGERAASGGLQSENDWQEPWWMARMIPDLMRASLQDNGLQGKENRDSKKNLTIASIETTSLKRRLIPALNELGAALTAWLHEDPLRKISLLGMLPETLRFEGNALELGSFLLQLELALRQEQELNPSTSATLANRHLKGAMNATRDALRMTVVNRAIGSGYFSQIEEQAWLSHLQSLSIWIPGNLAELHARKTEFSRSRLWQEAPRWAEWISNLYLP